MKGGGRRRIASETITIRPYEAGDFEFVRQMLADYTKHERRRLKEQGLVHSSPFAKGYLRSLPKRSRKGGVFLVATRGGTRAGCVAAIRKSRKENWSWDATRRPSGLVMELHVARPFRGRGVGGQHLRAVERHFQSRGSDWLSLGVFPTNETARAVYRKMGYRDAYVFMGKRLHAR